MRKGRQRIERETEPLGLENGMKRAAHRVHIVSMAAKPFLFPGIDKRHELAGARL